MSNINFFRILQSGGGESTVTFPDQSQDTFRITYTWTQGDGGNDLDTLTGIAPGTGTSYDGTLNAGSSNFTGFKTSTYGGKLFSVGPGNFASGNYFLAWAGDNTSGAGVEDILVNQDYMISQNSALTEFEIQLYSRWYTTIGTGGIDIAVELWTGGTWSDQGTVWANSGGTLQDTISFSLNCLKGTGYGNGLDFSQASSTTYKYMGKLIFESNGSGYVSVNLTQ
jgi:hypothetical protein|tara:strand:+ start:22 stop:693 length:672 start_codon:yes stop_codon:yes gene_type:complete